jgi:hypothetical protein
VRRWVLVGPVLWRERMLGLTNSSPHIPAVLCQRLTTDALAPRRVQYPVPRLKQLRRALEQLRAQQQQLGDALDNTRRAARPAAAGPHGVFGAPTAWQGGGCGNNGASARQHPHGAPL